MSKSKVSFQVGDNVLCKPRYRSVPVTGVITEVIASSAFPYTVEQDETPPGLSKTIVLAASEIVKVLP